MKKLKLRSNIMTSKKQKKKDDKKTPKKLKTSKNQEEHGREFDKLDPEFNNRLADEGINPSSFD